jgi:hypothetical protein
MERIWIRLGFSLTEKPMSTYPPADQPMAYSRLAGRELSTWSEEWKHEWEVGYLARMKPDKLRGMLYGVQGAQDETASGIKQKRGDAAVAQLVSEIERFKAATG